MFQHYEFAGERQAKKLLNATLFGSLPIGALILVICAGAAHASWNLIAKRAAAGADFVILYSLLACIVYAPVAIAMGVVSLASLSAKAWAWMLLSGALHFVYALLLQRGYQVGDLSIVYPVARGAGPLLAGVGSVMIFGERVTLPMVIGYAAVLGGIALLGWSGHRSGEPGGQRVGLAYGLATGLMIAAYTVVDAYLVRTVMIVPLLVDYASNAVRTVLLTPVMIQRRTQVAAAWREHRREAIAVALLMPVAYILVLYAVRLAPVSHVAPAREISMLFAVLLSGLVLGEPQSGPRMIAAGCIALGVVALSWR